MKLARLFPHPRDARIRFYATLRGKSHVYTVDGETAPTSVTTAVKRMFEPFNPNYVIGQYYESWQRNPGSPYYGMAKGDIKRYWARNGADASRLGTAMHAQIEQYVNDALDVAPSTAEFGYFLNWYSAFRHEYPNWAPYRTEWLVYDTTKKVAGSIDMVFRNTDDPTECMIVDWKRSKEIKTEGFRGKCGRGLASTLPDCNLTHFSLQLNTYKYVLEDAYGLRVTRMYVAVFHPNNNDYLSFEIDDMQETVAQMVAEM